MPEKHIEETVWLLEVLVDKGGWRHLPDIQSFLDGPGFVVEQSAD